MQSLGRHARHTWKREVKDWLKQMATVAFPILFSDAIVHRHWLSLMGVAAHEHLEALSCEAMLAGVCVCAGLSFGFDFPSQGLFQLIF